MTSSPWTCDTCGVATAVDPCWNCAKEQRCPDCGATKEGAFCTECGTQFADAPATSPTKTAVWQQRATTTATVTSAPPSASPAPLPPPAATTSAPPIEPAPQLDDDGLGANLRWAVASLRAHLVRLITISALAVLVLGIAALATYLITRLTDKMTVGPLFLVAFAANVVIWVVAWTYINYVFYRAWHAVVVGAVPTVQHSTSLERFGPLLALFVIMLPISTLPIAGGFALVTFEFLVGERLSAVDSFSEAISRCTSSARNFWATFAIGAFISFYLVAIGFVTGLIGSATSEGVFVSSANALFDSGTSGDVALTRVLGFLMVVAFGIPSLFVVVHCAGITSFAWARRMLGRPVGSAAP